MSRCSLLRKGDRGRLFSVANYRAFLELVFGSLNVARTDVPVLVLGAKRDGIVEPIEIRKLAAAYRTEAEIFPKWDTT